MAPGTPLHLQCTYQMPKLYSINMGLLKIKFLGAGKMAQHLKAFAAFTEEPGMILYNHMAAHNHL